MGPALDLFKREAWDEHKLRFRVIIDSVIIVERDKIVDISPQTRLFVSVTSHHAKRPNFIAFRGRIVHTTFNSDLASGSFRRVTPDKTAGFRIRKNMSPPLGRSTC